MNELYVDTPPQLATLCQELRRSHFVAVDTEFLREKTYYAQLCLIQVATPTIIACIDPLALETLDPLLEVLYDKHMLKVLHSARQDLEILFDLRGELPRPVFDTQVAAALTGLGDQASYSTVVQQLVQVTLDKSHTRADWSHRPLDALQIRYALDDVRYLVPVYKRLRTDLERRGRLEWLTEDFNALSDPQRYQNPIMEAWRRLRDARKLQGAQLAALRYLAAWREERAQALNRPRRWILGDDALQNLARRLPEDASQLAKIRGLDPAAVRRFGTAWLEAIKRARDAPRNDWPRLGTSAARLEPHQEAISELLMTVTRLRAAEHNISTAALASRKDLDAVVAGEQDVPILQGWRAAVAGNDLLATLAGQTRLRIRDGKLQIERLESHATPNSPTHTRG